MAWYIVGLIVAVGIFVSGFLVGKRHGARIQRAGTALKDTVGKM